MKHDCCCGKISFSVWYLVDENPCGKMPEEEDALVRED